MMTKRTLTKLLKAGESYRLERTVSTTNTDKFCQAICAFSNDLPNCSMPGYLLIGVKDDGDLSGLKVTDELLQNIAAMRSDGNILPLPLMSVETVAFSEGDEGDGLREHVQPGCRTGAGDAPRERQRGSRI